MPEKLKEKQRNLVEAFLLNPDSGMAALAKESGFKNAKSAANALSLPKVIEAIAARRDRQLAATEKRTDVSAQKVMQFWAEVMMFDPLEVMFKDDDGILKPKPYDDIPLNLRHIVSRTSIDGYKLPELTDRLAASEKLAKMYRMYEEAPKDEAQQGSSDIVELLSSQIRFASDEDLAKFDKLLKAVEVAVE